MSVKNTSMLKSAKEIWRRRKWPLILSFILVLSVTYSVILALPPMYQASTTIIFGQEEISEALVTTTTSSELEQRLEVVRQSILSRTHLQDIINTFNLYPELLQEESPETIINRLRNDISIQQEMLRQPQWGQNASFSIAIRYQGWDPQLVATVANDLASRYQLENEGIRTKQAASTTQFLSEQLAEVRQRFEENENRIETFKNSNLGGLPQQEGINLATLERLNSELRLNGERQVALMNRRDDLLLGINNGASVVAATGSVGVFRLERLKRELLEMETRYTSNYPDVIRVRSEISVLESQLQSEGIAPELNSSENDVYLQPTGRGPAEIETEFVALRIREQDLRANFAQMQRRIENTPRIEQELRLLENEYATVREQYLTLQRRFEDASLAESLQRQQSQLVQVLETAIPPAGSSLPQRQRLYIIAFFLAGIFAAAVVFLLEQFDTTIHTLEDIRGFTHLPVLGTVSRINTTGDRMRLGIKYLIGVIVFAFCVATLATLAYNFAQSEGKQLVWMMS